MAGSEESSLYVYWNIFQENKSTLDYSKVTAKTKELFDSKIEDFVKKIDNSIQTFRFNVAIAHFYEVYF